MATIRTSTLYSKMFIIRSTTIHCYYVNNKKQNTIISSSVPLVRLLVGIINTLENLSFRSNFHRLSWISLKQTYPNPHKLKKAAHPPAPSVLLKVYSFSVNPFSSACARIA